jgi:DNA-binding SARP family transcriptional activator
MHDYLAEEVLDHLDPPMQDFLIKASLLDDLDPTVAAAVAGASRDTATEYLEASEELAFVVRSDVAANHVFVPLMQEFLQSRLLTTVGPDRIREMHLDLARTFEGSDWRVSSTHYQRAGDLDRARAVVCNSLEAILANGQYRAADDLLADDGDQVVRGILRSRLLLQVGSSSEALSEATTTVRAAEQVGHEHFALAAQNAASIALATHAFDLVPGFAQQAHDASRDPTTRELASGYALIVGASAHGSFPTTVRQLEKMLASQIRQGQYHYAAVTAMNLAQCLVWLDQPEAALQRGTEAEQLLERSSRGYEIVSVRLAQAHAWALLGKWPEASTSLRTALATEHPEGEVEAALEAAAILAWYGPESMAREIVARIDRSSFPASWALHWRALDLWLADERSVKDIMSALPVDPTPTAEPGATFRWLLAVARGCLVLGDEGGFKSGIERLGVVVASQRSPVQKRLIEVLRALGSGSKSLERLLATWPATHDPILGVFAVDLISRLGDASPEARTTVERAATGAPHRWREPIRSAVKSEVPSILPLTAALLDDIGEAEDVALLRGISRRFKRPTYSWGDKLVHRLAQPVWISDLGPMSLSVGTRTILGHEVRRKVLSLLTFLVCQPSGSATPDRILDSLWPELSPAQGINSVHQTIYFLRRAIDPSYATGRSADYIHFDDDIVSLDSSLIDCGSWRCQRLLRQQPESQQLVEQLLDEYHGKFASDFVYEDWASAYRDTLHAAYLAVMERAVSGRLGAADLRWRLWIGQRVLAVDPDADEIEAEVIRLYQALGAPAAAAEQYTHYATVLRDQLGIEPPPLNEV